ncbi:MAG: MerR family transcriptional regulator [Pseudomonadota bacterium]
MDEQQSHYKIGAVSRITGIGSETLRAWERRYQAVTPSRTASGDRNYSRDDVAKLLLLKSMVDAGISIGTIASLSYDQLRQRAESDSILVGNVDGKRANVKNNENDVRHIALLGESIPIRVLDGLPEVNGIEVVGVYENVADLRNNLMHTKQPDVVVVEKPTINQNTHAEIKKIREVSGAWHIILIYGFSSQEYIEQIQSSQTTVIRSSVDVQELARLCIYHSGGSDRLPALQFGSTIHFEQTIPARSFSNKQLAELSQISNTIKCECPKHLTELLRDLVAFEIYSAECENENKQDAALHAYLHATTAQARSMLEESLSHLLRVEGISVT